MGNPSSGWRRVLRQKTVTAPQARERLRSWRQLRKWSSKLRKRSPPPSSPLEGKQKAKRERQGGRDGKGARGREARARGGRWSAR